MAEKKGQKKSFWSDDEKHTICAQARVAGVSVAQVARRYSMNANLIHKWLRDPRFATDFSDDVLEIDEVPAFLPVASGHRCHLLRTSHTSGTAYSGLSALDIHAFGWNWAYQDIP